MVAMNVWPTDASDGAVSSEARWRKMARFWVPSGVLEGVGGSMVPSLAMPNLTVQSGAAWVDGHYCELPSTQVITATANGIAVVRFDPAANTAELLWRDGISTPTQTPNGTWEIPIAKTVGSALTDLRTIVPLTAASSAWFIATGGNDALPTGLTSITWPSILGTAFTYDGPNKRLVCQMPGQYALSARAWANTSAPTDIRLLIGPSGDFYAVPTSGGMGTITIVRTLNQGDTVTTQMNNPGAATSTVAGGTRFEATRLKV